MGVFSKIVGNFVQKGGVLVTGVVCMFLARNRHLPQYMGLISYGITSLGILGILTYYLKEEDEDPGYEERMAEFNRIKPELERKLKEQAELAAECERFIRMRDRMERWAEQSKQLERRVKKVEQTVQRRIARADVFEQSLSELSPESSTDIPGMSSTEESTEPSELEVADSAGRSQLESKLIQSKEAAVSGVDVAEEAAEDSGSAEDCAEEDSNCKADNGRAGGTA